MELCVTASIRLGENEDICLIDSCHSEINTFLLKVIFSPEIPTATRREPLRKRSIEINLRKYFFIKQDRLGDQVLL